MNDTPFFDPNLSYYDNFEKGPFGIFGDEEKYREENEPEYEILGHKVHLPFGIPAGPLLNGNFVKAALDKGFDIPVHKTVRTRYKKCHEWPNVLPVDVEDELTLEQAGRGLTIKDSYSEPLSITNSFGNPSFDPDVWQKDITSCVEYAKDGQMVAASFEGTRWEGGEAEYVNDWVLGAKLLKETGLHFIEANLSCPNEGTTALLCFDVERVQKISHAIKEEVGDLPLILKISYFDDEQNLKKLIDATGNIVDGYSTINTISAEVRDKDGNQALPGEGRLRSGVCGHSIKWAGIDMVKRIHNHRITNDMKFSIIGVGGVMDVSDYNEYIEAGADMVMSATGAMWNPHLAIDIKKTFL